ncbi:membrane protein [Streptococcus pneumoniae]|nr:membrane protein [Streptococcus pneumoniae]COG96447.1 membrane protein [Streptococcus pneumoniae]
MAMLLPGISGSFILLIIGVYPTAINALTTLNLPLILVIGAGVMVGFVVSSKGISFLLDRYKSMTFAAIIGLVIGSIVIVFPGIPTGGFSIISSIITFILGFAIVTYFGKK